MPQSCGVSCSVSRCCSYRSMDFETDRSEANFGACRPFFVLFEAHNLFGSARFQTHNHRCVKREMRACTEGRAGWCCAQEDHSEAGVSLCA